MSTAGMPSRGMGLMYPAPPLESRVRGRCHCGSRAIPLPCRSDSFSSSVICCNKRLARASGERLRSIHGFVAASCALIVVEPATKTRLTMAAEAILAGRLPGRIIEHLHGGSVTAAEHNPRDAGQADQLSRFIALGLGCAAVAYRKAQRV